MVGEPTQVPEIRVGVEIPDTDAEGPGRRYAIWVQGCPLRCRGCCNPELLPFEGGRSVRWTELLERVLAARERAAIEGVSLLGGEPFSHAEGLAPLAEALRERGLTVMIYSGWTLAELRERGEPSVARLLAACDLLVDGRYERELPDHERRFVGSRNQIMHVLSEAHSAEDPRFRAQRSVELRLVEGELTINGWPLAGAKVGKS